jgi:predicted nucleic acid-binding Zn finger protein
VKLDTRGRFCSCSFCLSEVFLKGDEDEEELEGTGLEDVGVGLR